VRAAATAGESVKVAGTGHSFTDIACTDGRLIKLDRYAGVLEVDRQRATATAQAGITIARLSNELARHGLAMENMGDVAYQTISGAISTATHGTGERLRNISSQVCALSLVLADGELLHCSPTVEREIFTAARVGMGALGVISTVTLQCVPAFNLQSVEEPRRLDDVLETFDELSAANDHSSSSGSPTQTGCRRSSTTALMNRHGRRAACAPTSTISCSRTTSLASCSAPGECGAAGYLRWRG